jgi:soluble lytic murein transglycosylase
MLLALLAPPAASAQGSSAVVDSAVAAAARAIDGGRAWEATRLLAPIYRDSSGRTPSVLLTAATAAARWDGWATVVRLLDGERWLDSVQQGAGRALLARALVERTEAEAALRPARRAVELATDETRGERLLTYARALDRAGRLDSAAAAYAEAARALPEVADWLELRAAGVTADSAARRRIYEGIDNPVAVKRIQWTEALALDRTGDKLAAARRYEAVGASVAAIRARLASGDTAARREARARLGAILTPELSRGDSYDAIELFDRYFQPRTAQEELRIARRAAAINQLDRAARGYGAAGRALLTDRDRFTYATVLSRLGRPGEAIPLFDGVRSRDLLGDAAYQRARILLRSGRVSEALAALTRIAPQFAADSEPAAASLYLAGDLLADRGLDDSARTFFLAAGTGYPTVPSGRRAAFQAALIAFLDGKYPDAAAEFDRLAGAPPNADEAVAAGYWAGRALFAQGDTAAARSRWSALIERARDSYYAVLAARRLDTTLAGAWRAGGDEPARGALPDQLARAARLIQLGLKVEARFELDAYQTASTDAEALRRTAEALAQASWFARGSRVAQRALERGTSFDRRLAELIYPLPFQEVLVAEARAAGVDPALVAGVIRQESLFDPEARSVADARGLMQVLPSVGAQLARSAGIGEFEPVLLYQPAVNLPFGIEHLSGALKRFEWPARALAAYNAGADRVDRWQSIRGVRDDPEIFVERIPFAETRDYVRKVLRNQALYRTLYPEIEPTS